MQGGGVIMRSHLVIPNGSNICGNNGFLHKGKGDGCHEDSMNIIVEGILELDAFLALKILDLFEKLMVI
jgi:hypothetical protein